MTLHPVKVKQMELLLAVGEVMHRWANLETQLAFTFCRALKLSIVDGCKLLVHIKTFALKMDIVNEAVKIGLAGKPSERWNSIAEFVRELSGDRNFVAHTPIIFHGPGDPSATESWGNVEVKIGPPTVNHYADIGKIRAIDQKEVLEIALDIQQAVELLMEFERLTQHQPLSEALSQKIERRRPPRAQRIGSEPPFPKLRT